MLHNLSLGPVVATDLRDPVVVMLAAVHPVNAPRNVPQQRQGQLRAEARRKVNGVPHGVAPAATQVEVAQLGVRLAVIRHRRDDPVFEDLHRNHVFNADAHRVAGEALGVRDDHVVGGRAKGVPQGRNLRRSAPAPGGREGFVRDKDHLRGHRAPVHAETSLRSAHQAVHHLADVRDIEARAVVGAVTHLRGEQLDNGTHPALTHGVFAFNDQGASAHPKDGAVTPPVKRQRGLFNFVVRRSGPGCQEARADPLQQAVASHIISADHQDAAAAPTADPVLGKPDGLGGRGTSGVDLRVWPPRPDVFGKLTVAHRQHAEQEASVKLVRVGRKLLTQRGNAPHQGQHRTLVTGLVPQIFQLIQQGVAIDVLVVALELIGQPVSAGEGRGENHASLVTQRLRQHPAFGQEGALAGLFVGLDERNASLTQRIEARRNRQLRRHVERLDQFLRHPVLGAQVKAASAPGEADNIVAIVNRQEAARAIFALHHAGDVLGDHQAAEALGDKVNQLVAAQDALDIIGGHHRLFGAGQTEAGAADHHRTGGRRIAVEVGWRGGRGVGACPNSLERLNQQCAERIEIRRRPVAVRATHRRLLHGRNLRSLTANRNAGGTDLHRGRRRNRRGQSRCRHDHRFLGTWPGGKQAAERLVKTGDLARLRMVREERHHVGLAAQHIIHKTLERLLRAALDEDPAALTIERLQTFHPLHRRGDLQFQDVLNALNRGWVEFASDVRHQGQARRVDVQPIQHLAERLRRRSHDLRVEGVADRDALGLKTLLDEKANGLLNRRAFAANHGLAVAVDVRRDHVAVNRIDGRLNHIEGCHHRSHPAIVAHTHLGHLGPACSGSLKRLGERHNPGGNQRPILAQRVAHHHIGPHAVLTQQRQKRHIKREHRRLRDRRLHQGALGLFQHCRVAAIHKEEIGKRSPQNGRHHRVRLLEDIGDSGRKPHQFRAHVEILAALPGEEKRDFAGRLARTTEHTLRGQRLPGCCHIETRRLRGFRQLIRQIRPISEIQHQPLGLAQLGEIGCGDWRCPATLNFFQRRRRLRGQLGGRGRPKGQDPAQRRLLGNRRRRRVVQRALAATRRRQRRPRVARRLSLQHPRHILLQHQMEVRTAKTVGTHRRPSGEARRFFPLTRLVEQVEGRLGKFDVGIRHLAVERRWQNLLVNGEHRLEQTSRARTGLQVADVALGRTKPNPSALGPGEDLRQTFGLGCITDAGASAVRLNQGTRGGVKASIAPSPFHRKDLPDGIGSGNALALAIGRSAHTANNRVDFVAIALRIGQPLEQEGR